MLLLIDVGLENLTELMFNQFLRVFKNDQNPIKNVDLQAILKWLSKVTL